MAAAGSYGGPHESWSADLPSDDPTKSRTPPPLQQNRSFHYWHFIGVTNSQRTCIDISPPPSMSNLAKIHYLNIQNQERNEKCTWKHQWWVSREWDRLKENMKIFTENDLRTGFAVAVWYLLLLFFLRKNVSRGLALALH